MPPSAPSASRPAASPSASSPRSSAGRSLLRSCAPTPSAGDTDSPLKQVLSELTGRPPGHPLPEHPLEPEPGPPNLPPAGWPFLALFAIVTAVVWIGLYLLGGWPAHLPGAVGLLLTLWCLW